MQKPYVGYGFISGKAYVFTSDTVPTTGKGIATMYDRVVGPFRTQRAAKWVAANGYGCHFDTIAEAEYWAKVDAQNHPGFAATYRKGEPKAS